MSEGYPREKTYSNKRFSEVISEGFYLFGKSWTQLIIPLGLIFIISLLIKNLLVADLNWRSIIIIPSLEFVLQKDPTSLNNDDLNIMFEYLTLILSTEFINNLTTSFFNVFSMCLVSKYLLSKFYGNPARFFTEVKYAFNRRLLLVILLLGVGVALGSFLLFIPSIILYGYYIFYIYTYRSEGEINPIKEAREVARGAFWKIISIFILYNLVLLVCDFIFQLLADSLLLQIYNSSWYNPSTRNYGAIILYDILLNIPEFLIAPLFICLLTSLYVYLKNKREQQVQYQAPNYQPMQINTFNRPDISKNMNSGLYCAFCGKYFRRDFEFCPHCGEKNVS